MNIVRKIRQAWKGVEDAHSKGFLHNHDMLVFAFCNPLSDMPGPFPAIYDGRQLPDIVNKPNFYIWSDHTNPAVIFVGKLRFKPSNSSVIEQDLSELRNYIKRPEINALTDGGKQSETRMQMSPEADFGYFILTDQSRHSVEKKIHHSLTDDERSRFHFAYGPAGEDDEQPPNFQYIPPQLRTE